ncbi:sensor domain-containing protein [Paenibacillus sp. GXUN7292]|uniref:sensor domain-containing protein n=1 Tax=Paenibacillus sp. GXUN7292 TaxID=3422499 RepID=UPI003D7DFF88
MNSGYIQNGYFLLLTFASGLFYFCFFMVALSFTLALSFTVVGIPLLIRVLRSTAAFIQFERTQTKIYTDISTKPYHHKVESKGSVWALAKLELTDRRNWVAVFWLMQKFIIGLLSLICFVLLYLMPIIFILSPLLYRYINIQFIFIPIDTYLKSFMLMTLGVVLCIISFKLADKLAKSIGRYTKRMMEQLNR